MDRDGTLRVADSELLDYDAGLTSITLEVIAIDTKGNISAAETVTINVTNLLDEDSEQPVAETNTVVKKSGGSTGLIALLLLQLALLPLLLPLALLPLSIFALLTL